MTDLSNEVRDAFDALFPPLHTYETAKRAALIAAVEAAQLQRLGTLSDAEIVEAAAKAMVLEVKAVNDERLGPTVHPWEVWLIEDRERFRRYVRAALPILQAPLRAEIERLKAHRWQCAKCRFVFWKPVEPEPHKYPIGEPTALSPEGACPVCGTRDTMNEVTNIAEGLRERLATTAVRVQQLTEALTKYGMHNTHCAKFGPLNPRCSCGLAALQP